MQKNINRKTSLGGNHVTFCFVFDCRSRVPDSYRLECPEIRVDKTVFTESPEIRLSAPAAQDRAILIRDMAGRVVRTMDISRGCTSCIWDGRDARGSKVGAGVYFITIENASRTAQVRVVRY